MYLTKSKTTFFGRRIGYNEEKRKRFRAHLVRRGFGGFLRWFKRRGWIVCILLVALGTAGWMNRFYLQRLNPMEIRNLQYIDIEGNRMLSWEDVVQSAQVEPGMKMAEIQTDSVEKALMNLPLIASAKVEKHFPSSLSIILEEATPILAVFDEGKAQVYSEQGVILPLSSMTAVHLPIVAVEDKDKIRSMSHFLNEMRENDKELYERVSQVSWSEADSAFEVYFRDVGHKALFSPSAMDKTMFELYETVKMGFPQDMHCALEVDMRFNGFAYIRNFDKRCVNG